MKHWTLALAVAGAIAALSGCKSDAQTPKETGSQAASTGAAADRGDGDQKLGEGRLSAPAGSSAVTAKAGALNAQDEEKARLAEIAISDAGVKQVAGERKGERLWEVTATVRNGGSVALPGVELIADLRASGEEHAFARNSAEVRFEVPLQPGAAFAWRSLSPVVGKNPPASATVTVKAARWLEPRKVNDGWKPLDPATATPKTVGETITIPVGAAKPSSAKSTP